MVSFLLLLQPIVTKKGKKTNCVNKLKCTGSDYFPASHSMNISLNTKKYMIKKSQFSLFSTFSLTI